MLNIKKISLFEIFSSNLKLEHEFDRRVEEFNFQSNGNENDEERFNLIPVSLINKLYLRTIFFHSQISNAIPTSSPSATDEMNEFDEK